jgi:hypothetical protein
VEVILMETRHRYLLLIPAMAFAALMAALGMGCQPGVAVLGGGLTDLGGASNAPDPWIRTGGGSIPDGSGVSGTTVTYDSAQVRALALSMSYEPVSGTRVVLVAADGQTMVATSSDGVSTTGGLNSRSAGLFAFNCLGTGKYVLSIDLNRNLVPTLAEVRTDTVEGIRSKVVASLVPSGSVSQDGKETELDLSCSTSRVSPNSGPVVVSGVFAHLNQASPDIVWVMQTKTDATIQPGPKASQVVVVPGQVEGSLSIRASLETGRTREVRIDVEGS